MLLDSVFVQVLSGGAVRRTDSLRAVLTFTATVSVPFLIHTFSPTTSRLSPDNLMLKQRRRGLQAQS